MRWQGQYKKVCGFIFIVVPQKTFFLWGRRDANLQKHGKNLKLKFDYNYNNNCYFSDNNDEK